jgi:hypothetical protein
MEIVTSHRFNDGIEAVRGIFPKLRINKALCRDLVEAVKRYKLQKNERLSTEDKTVYHKEPVKDATRHPADALRHLAMAYRYQLMIAGQRIGYPNPIPANVYAGEEEKYDALNFGLRKRV